MTGDSRRLADYLAHILEIVCKTIRLDLPGLNGHVQAARSALPGDDAGGASMP